MYVNEKRISVSLSTVEIEPAGAGTKLKYTEQCAFLDGYDDAGSREQGTRWLLDQDRRVARRVAVDAGSPR